MNKEFFDSVLVKLTAWERDANAKAKNSERSYQWGFADGIGFSKKLILAELMKAEKAQIDELAQ